MDAGLNAVIADFGFVTPLPITVGSTTLVTAAGALTLAWSRGHLALEVTDGKHGVSSDVYSYGVVRVKYVYTWRVHQCHICYRLHVRLSLVYLHIQTIVMTKNWLVLVLHITYIVPKNWSVFLIQVEHCEDTLVSVSSFKTIARQGSWNIGDCMPPHLLLHNQEHHTAKT